MPFLLKNKFEKYFNELLLKASDESQCKKIQSDSLYFICSEKLISNEKGFYALKCLLILNPRLSSSFDEYDPFKQAKFIQFLTESLEQILKNTTKSQPNNNNSEKVKSFFYSQIDYLTLIFEIICAYSNSSLSFGLQFLNTNTGLKILFDLLRHFSDKLSTNLTNNNNTETNELSHLVIFNSFYELVKLNLSCLFGLSKSKLAVNLWKEVDYYVPVLFILIQHYQRLKEISALASLIIANICHAKDFSKLKYSLVIKSIVEMLNDFVDDLSKNESNRKVDENSEEKTTNNLVQFYKDVSSVIDLLEYLIKFSSEDSLKGQVYFDFGLKQILGELLKYGNEVDLECALRLLLQLCFDQKVCHDAKNDQPLNSTINNLLLTDANRLGHTKSENDTLVLHFSKKQLTENCKAVKWLLNIEESTKGLVNENSGKSRYLMISYDCYSKDLCFTIKNELEKMGYKTWIDVDNISDSRHDSIAKAVEESQCVLMCMTEKYKQSASCRLEAEYAVRLKKPVIPLIVEKGYRPDGWLANLLGTKIYIDFTKHELNECMRHLKIEIEHVCEVVHKNINETSSSKIETIKTVLVEPAENLESKDVIEWNENEVSDWLFERQFMDEIIISVFPSDGKLLYEMYLMLKHVPESFFKSLMNEQNIKLKDLAYFSRELKKLFEN